MVHISTDTTTTSQTVGLFVHGQLDLTAFEVFCDALTRATHVGDSVEVHLGEVDFIDGSGLSLLIDAITQAQRAGHRLSIADASHCVRRLIEITNTADRLPPLPAPANSSRGPFAFTR